MSIDLMLLQERCRRDPLSYRDDFLSQRRHFDALLTSTSLRPSAPSPRLTEVASFIGGVAHCYKEASHEICPPVAKLLSQNGPAMNPDTRRALVKLLALLRARGVADAGVVIPLFFRLLACQDKPLRRMLHGCIVSDVKKVGMSGERGGRRELQAFLFSMVEEKDELLVKRSLSVLIDLFRKRIWNESKCANMIANACFHQSMPVAMIAARFMLDSESKDQGVEDDDEDEEEVNHKPARDGQKAAELWKAFNMTAKKGSKKRKRMERVIGRLTRIKSAVSQGPVSECKPGHPALEAMMLVNDPQEFAERLFSDLQNRRRRESYESRLVLINLISRLVGTHELILFNLYPFLQRYLQPAHPEVTRVLAYLTQACHERVPSDVLHPILRGLADRFVSERSSPPAVAAGLNTIRAICSRVPLAILDEDNEYKPEDEQESPLLEDLVQYKSGKDKGIMMAARSLIALYREVHPKLLHKKDRGRAGAEAVQKGHGGTAKAYGHLNYATGVEGIHLLKAKEPSEADGDDSNDDCSDIEVAEEEVGWEKEGRPEGLNNEAGDEAGLEEQDGCDDESGDEIERAAEKAGSAGAEECEGATVNDEEADSGTDEEDAESGKKQQVEELQILSNEDFAKIRARRAQLAIGISARTTNTGAAVDPDDLQGPLKKEKRTLAERLEIVKEGRAERDAFGSRKGQNKGGGSTNKKKLKTKANSMVIHKRRKRGKVSRREKQMSMRKKRDYK